MYTTQQTYMHAIYCTHTYEHTHTHTNKHTHTYSTINDTAITSGTRLKLPHILQVFKQPSIMGDGLYVGHHHHITTAFLCIIINVVAEADNG